MASIHFPSEVFSLIKSFTKPKIVCSCCAYDDCGSKYIIRDGDIICNDCDKNYCCYGCEICDMENEFCVDCGDLVCDQVDCSTICEDCGNVVCVDCVNEEKCDNCYEEDDDDE